MTPIWKPAVAAAAATTLTACDHDFADDDEADKKQATVTTESHGAHRYAHTSQARHSVGLRDLSRCVRFVLFFENHKA